MLLTDDTVSAMATSMEPYLCCSQCLQMHGMVRTCLEGTRKHQEADPTATQIGGRWGLSDGPIGPGSTVWPSQEQFFDSVAPSRDFGKLLVRNNDFAYHKDFP